MRRWCGTEPALAVDGVGRWRRVNLEARIEARLGVKMHERAGRKQLFALGFGPIPVRPQRPRYDPEAQEAFNDVAMTVTDALPAHARGKPLEIRFQVEARVGQKGMLTRIRAPRGSRSRAFRATR